MLPHRLLSRLRRVEEAPHRRRMNLTELTDHELDLLERELKESVSTACWPETTGLNSIRRPQGQVRVEPPILTAKRAETSLRTKSE